ncbi:MAG: DUF6913 domain-containing protein [Bacteroidales bacterium]
MLTYFIKKEILANLRASKNHRNFTDFSELSNVTIIYELSDYKQSIELKSILCLANCSVSLVGYNGDKKRLIQGEEGYLFSSNELTFLGKPKEAIVAEFNRIITGSDLLIDITRGKFLPINYLMSQKGDVLKVGLEVSDFKLYDFILEVPKNVDSKFLCQQILFYLRKLKSKRPRIVPQL